MASIAERLIDPTTYSSLDAEPRSVSGVVGYGWSILIGQNNIGPQYELTMAKSATISFHVDDSASFVFTLDGADPALPYIQELVTDVWLYRNGILLFRGRIGSCVDSLDGTADTYDVQINVFDYREWLSRQILQPTHIWSWRNVTQAKIINDMFTYCINGQTGIHPTFVIDTTKMSTNLTNYDVTAGTSMKEAIGTMSGFGWQVYPTTVPAITLKAITPWYYGLNYAFVLEYGATVDKVTRNLDTAGYANSSIFTGNTNLAPIQSDAANIATAPQGRIGHTASNPAIVDLAHLRQAAANEANSAQTVVPTWSCHMKQGSWTGPQDAWLGDICRFFVWKNRLKINDQYRITDIEIGINDDSGIGDDVTITVVRPPYVPSS